MGYYINTTSKGEILAPFNKVEKLVQDGATIISSPTEFQENLVCVVRNAMFEAAGYAYSEREMEHFQYSEFEDGRERTWLIYKHAAKLSGYRNS